MVRWTLEAYTVVLYMQTFLVFSKIMKSLQEVGDFVVSCQTYEGGISCADFGETHGGYTYCGFAALLLLKESDKLDLERCLEWLMQR